MPSSFGIWSSTPEFPSDPHIERIAVSLSTLCKSSRDLVSAPKRRSGGAGMILGGNDTRHVPLGDSGAAAIVVAVLYLFGAAAIIANWQKTGFHYYKALITSTAREIPRPSPAAGCSVCQHTACCTDHPAAKAIRDLLSRA